MAEEAKHPTEILVDDIARFTEDIESLHTTLPMMMHVTGLLRKDADKKHLDYVSGHGKVKVKSEESTTYTLKFEDMSAVNRLKRNFENFNVATRLIPRHFVTSLVSQYDSFLGRIIRFMFSVKPEMLNASDKSLSFVDLTRFQDIASARAFVMEKEIEAVIRKSHADQFDWLRDKLKIPFNKGLACWPDFIELTERRNLFVHTDGKVSSQYLTVCAEHKCATDKILRVGDQLEVSNAYFENSYKCIFEIGVKMAHVIWRKMCPDRIAESDSNIVDITLELIHKSEYALAIRLLDFFVQKQMKHSDDNSRRIMLINQAQAYKWNGSAERCKEVLHGEDWSACGDKFKLGIAALSDDYSRGYEIMRRLKHDESFHRSFYKDWPIFREFRKQDVFAEVYEECYAERFAMEQITKSQNSVVAHVIPQLQTDDKAK
ncbi:MAG TPA: hypothetical protein DET40_02350 [Lentisphaeria bacterium]|nr:MAG: hypothetical protein A2X45_16950 [Lentisphaerae bacterium GWF2_50_93]HCE42373.1 hypothetical protein [Lentisphaeria bacterium]